MPGCISIRWRCSSSRPCTHLSKRLLYSPSFENLEQACKMSPLLSMWEAAVKRSLATLPSSKEIEPLLWFEGHGTRFYTRVERNKSQNWQLVTEQGMWKALHISLLPTRWSGYIYIGQKLITTFASSDIFIWPVIKVRDNCHCQNDEFLEKVRTAFNPPPLPPLKICGLPPHLPLVHFGPQ